MDIIHLHVDDRELTGLKCLEILQHRNIGGHVSQDKYEAKVEQTRNRQAVCVYLDIGVHGMPPIPLSGGVGGGSVQALMARYIEGVAHLYK